MDGYGECCSSGLTDACGTCGGAAVHVDAAYACCTSGLLDAGTCSYPNRTVNSLIGHAVLPLS